MRGSFLFKGTESSDPVHCRVENALECYIGGRIATIYGVDALVRRSYQLIDVQGDGEFMEQLPDWSATNWVNPDFTGHNPVQTFVEYMNVGHPTLRLDGQALARLDQHINQEIEAEVLRAETVIRPAMAMPLVTTLSFCCVFPQRPGDRINIAGSEERDGYYIVSSCVQTSVTPPEYHVEAYFDTDQTTPIVTRPVQEPATFELPSYRTRPRKISIRAK
jgi:hypothetical protein